MMTIRLQLSALLCLCAGAALAADPAPFTYAEFEASVPHFDLADCPPSLAHPGQFCRVTFNEDAVHVFVFSEDTNQPMIGFKSFEDGEYALSIK
jgi:hypothetical protein